MFTYGKQLLERLENAGNCTFQVLRGPAPKKRPMIFG